MIKSSKLKASREIFWYETPGFSNSLLVASLDAIQLACLVQFWALCQVFFWRTRSNVNVDGLGCVELDEVRFELPADHALENESGEEVADKFQLDRLILQLRLEKVQSPRIEEHYQDDQVQQSCQTAEESLNTEVQVADCGWCEVAERPQEHDRGVNNRVSV